VTLAISAQSDKYAVKSVFKQKIQAKSLQESLLMEREVLLRLQHPFLPRLFKTFQDSECIYFLSEFTDGECLFDVMTDRGVFTTPETRFLIGNLLLIIDYLHERKVIHRDLKPEYLLLTSKGYLFLTDLASAKYCERTNSVIGTPQFMSPEVIMGKMYGAAVDLWSLGVIMYEFLTGGLPFAQVDDDPYSICHQILTETVKFPLFLPETAISLMNQLFSRTPADRGTSQDLKFHPFFLNFPFVTFKLGRYSRPNRYISLCDTCEGLLARNCGGSQESS
jgi:cGMP-dependent protein kinase